MIKTPYYLIDKQKLLVNLQKIAYVREQSGAKALLALKCFATWSVFDLMEQYMDGTTSSSLYELKLGRQKFAGETHAYSVAWADDEIDEMLANSDKVIFNSIGQLERFAEASKDAVRGLRVNPQVSSSDYLLADPARPFSRLGEWDAEKIAAVMDKISGFMFHNNCENGSFELFDQMIEDIRKSVASTLYLVRIQRQEDRAVRPVVSGGQSRHDEMGQFAGAVDGQAAAAGAKAQAAAGPMAQAAAPRNATVVRAYPKVGRNDPCPCGSGKKYKHCHGKLS